MKKIFGFLLGIMLLISLTGCGANRLVGTYSLVELTENGETYGIDVLKMVDLSYELDVQDSKNAILKLTDEDVKLTYDNEKFVNVNSETTIPYSVSGNRITIEFNNEKMVFEKK